MNYRTPGPWAYQEESDGFTHIVRGPTGQHIVQFSQDTKGRSEANARLTASAPELLEALRELHDFAEVDKHSRYVERSKSAFTNAAKLLDLLEEKRHD